MTFDISELDGKWLNVINEFTNYLVPTKRNMPCPFCGGDDRFTYTNKHNNGTWLCRKCTPDGSDGIGFISKKLNYDRKETFKRIATRYQFEEPQLDIVELKYQSTFVKLPCKPNWDGHTLLNKDKRYNFKYIWNWLDHNADFYAYVARMEFFSKEKQEEVKIIWQIHYGHPEEQPDKIGWYQVAIQPKPLFGFKYNWQQKPIIIVEGEKTCHALQELTTDYSILSTQGGASQIHCTDWDTLKHSTEIYIWPDLDEPGLQYAQQIKKIFPHAHIIDTTKLRNLGLQDKQDAADLKSLSTQQLQELLKYETNYRN